MPRKLTCSAGSTCSALRLQHCGACPPGNHEQIRGVLELGVLSLHCKIKVAHASSAAAADFVRCAKSLCKASADVCMATRPHLMHEWLYADFLGYWLFLGLCIGSRWAPCMSALSTVTSELTVADCPQKTCLSWHQQGLSGNLCQPECTVEVGQTAHMLENPLVIPHQHSQRG